MVWLIVLIVISLPAIEIVLFIESVALIGGLATVALATLAIVSGFYLLRQQGLAVLWRARTPAARGEMMAGDLFDTLCLTLAGVLLILPGFLTDLLALPLLLPPVRSWLRRRLAPRPSVPGGRASVIDGDFRVVEDAPPRTADSLPRPDGTGAADERGRRGRD